MCSTILHVHRESAIFSCMKLLFSIPINSFPQNSPCLAIIYAYWFHKSEKCSQLKTFLLCDVAYSIISHPIFLQTEFSLIAHIHCISYSFFSSWFLFHWALFSQLTDLCLRQFTGNDLCMAFGLRCTWGTPLRLFRSVSLAALWATGVLWPPW